MTKEKEQYKMLTVLGDSYKTTYTKKYENRKKWVKPNDKLITAFIPGTVSELFVKEGQEIKKEDKLLVLVAMKMNNTIVSPKNGKIKKVNVKAGDKVPKDFALIEID